MFQYLPHLRRLCDEPNQARPPAAPAALERKHPVDARQQRQRPLVRSRPRGAGTVAHRLWQGSLAARRQLPVGPSRHQRPQRRVRRQYPKVAIAMLMLARRRYQRRYPIQKSAGAQATWNVIFLVGRPSLVSLDGGLEASGT